MDTEAKTSNPTQQDQQGSNTAVPQFEETKEQTSPLKQQEDLTEQMDNLKINEQEKTSPTKDPKSNNLAGNKGDNGAKSDDEILTRKIKDVNLSSSDDSDNDSPTTDKTGELTIDGKVYKIKEAPNLFFYSNKMKSKPYGTYIKIMHERWKGNYDRLEDDHSYIQWLFPNFYQSAFNSAADPLTKEEAECFKTNLPLAQTLVKSYELILDFYGMRLANRLTGDIERSENFAPRYKDALLTYYHNHLRMRRILTHLNNVGFRRYAIKLVDFLEKEIYGEVGGYVKYENETKDFNKKAFESAPLRKLAKVSGTFPIWRMYGDHKDNPKKIAVLEKNCFSKYPEDFTDSVYFNS